MRGRLVSLQFMLNNTKVIPKGIPSRGMETTENLEKRTSHASIGSLIIQNVEKIDVSALMLQLVSSGYQLVDAFQQERTHEKGGRTYNIVRFTFSVKEHATPSEEFLKIKPAMMNALYEMVTSSFWKVRAYRNPFFEKGIEVAEEYAVSIDLAERVPRFDGNGRLVSVWLKDGLGNRIGDSPVPISPDGEIHLQDDQIKIVLKK